MNWFYYLFEANVYLTLFYGFYKLILNKETFHMLNRFYLIAASALAFVFPFFQFGFLKTPLVSEISLVPVEQLVQVNQQVNLSEIQVQQSVFTPQNGIICVYVLVTLFFLLKLGLSMRQIMKMRKRPFRPLENGVKVIDLKASKTAFSFFNLLFMDPELPEKNTILKHELVHIKQKHSADVLFFELMQALNWFNPISYMLRKEVKLVHEYLADAETTKTDVEKYDYALFLIQNSSGIQEFALTNQIFSSSILKRRINMLNQKKSARWARLKMLLVLPLATAILCISTMAFTKNSGVVELFPNSTELVRDTNKFEYATIKQIEKGTTFFTTHVRVDGKTKKQTSTEKRLLVINGQKIQSNDDFFAAANFDQKVELSSADAAAKYGEVGKFGAVELYGKKIKVLKTLPAPPPFPQISLQRNKNKPLIIPDSDFDRKTLTIYNERGTVVYNTTDYKDDWNGKKGNYGKYLSALPAGKYQYFMKIDGKPFASKRGQINMTD